MGVVYRYSATHSLTSAAEGGECLCVLYRSRLCDLYTEIVFTFSDNSFPSQQKTHT